jgi:predicted transcriptional regulator
MAAESIGPLLTAKIVGSYVRHHRVGAGQLPDLIATVHRTLGELGQPNPPEDVLTPAVSVRQSVRHDYVVCLDCGYRGKTLRRHIRTRHSLSRDEYLKRWGLRNDHLLTAPAYSERRSSLAKEFGLGRTPKAQVAPAATPVVAAAPVDADPKTHTAPPERRRSRSRSKQADVVSEAAAAPTPARKRRSRSRAASPPLEPIPSPTAEIES